MIGFYNYSVILTYIGVASAITGIGMAVNGNPSVAIVCLMISGFCDLFDGSIARTCKRSDLAKKFGIQIDSLADLICFGALPVAIGYAIGMNSWYEIAVLSVYALAALIRLAYYNVTEDVLQMTENTHRTHYDGLPVTTVALLIPLIYNLRVLLKDNFHYLYMAWLLLIATAFLTKIRIRKLDMKGMILAAILGASVLISLIVQWNVHQ